MQEAALPAVIDTREYTAGYSTIHKTVEPYVTPWVHGAASARSRILDRNRAMSTPAVSSAVLKASTW